MGEEQAAGGGGGGDEGGGPAQAGQDGHGQAGRVMAAQCLDGQDGQQQRWPGGQSRGDQQDEQAQGLGLGGVVERLDDGPVDHDEFSHGGPLWSVTVWAGSDGSAAPAGRLPR